MSVHFVNDDLRSMARWAARHYGLVLKVQFCTGWELKDGLETEFLGHAEPISKNEILITLNVVKQSLFDMMPTLAHELAHCLTWKEKRLEGHGPEFKKNLSRVVRDWNEHLGKGARYAN